ncbi:hypothetical protein V5735_03195 (plasmid) [Haladaptatus sp. SPP-AMP-3]|uniref:hypothetical protein n=1 Tax=Haladaptatus sp. SPP-AMP-3 TaxID=3121295 RepID=UPI003C30C89A
MTTNESEPTTESSPHEAVPRSEVEALREELEATKERLRIAEKNLKWMAQHQAVETGKSVCPTCNSNGSLGVERTATGKKKVECTNCGERLI